MLSNIVAIMLTGIGVSAVVAISLGRLDRWVIILLSILVADSAITVMIGSELNPLILVTMDAFGVDLGSAMVLRLLYLAPPVYIIARWSSPKFVSGLYLTGYTISALALNLT